MAIQFNRKCFSYFQDKIEDIKQNPSFINYAKATVLTTTAVAALPFTTLGSAFQALYYGGKAFLFLGTKESANTHFCESAVDAFRSPSLALVHIARLFNSTVCESSPNCAASGILTEKVKLYKFLNYASQAAQSDSTGIKGFLTRQGASRALFAIGAVGFALARLGDVGILAVTLPVATLLACQTRVGKGAAELACTSANALTGIVEVAMLALCVLNPLALDYKNT